MGIYKFFKSILSFIFTLYVYFKHDKKIKKQSALINENQLNKIEKEKTEDKKAFLKTEIHKEKKGKRELIIFNIGRVTATNVDVKFLDVKNLKILNNPCPINISPTNYINISLFISEFCPNKLDFTITWDDEFSYNNFINQTLQI